MITTESEGSKIMLYAPEANVLIVDDYDANLKVASGLLELSGIKCDTAADGETAVAMAGQKQYDLIFMDHMMPGMDGVETMQSIRRLGGANGGPPIVALTANAISGVKEMLIEQGMNDFLSKPIDRELLNKILLKWLPQHKVQPQGKPAGPPAKPADTGNDESPLIRGLRAIPDIDLEYGLGLMGGREDLYASTFAIMHRKLFDNVEKLAACLEEDRMSDFMIEIHGLKGALYNVGCRRLGSLAAALETASKRGDRSYCLQHYAGLRHSLLSFQQQAGQIINDLRPQERKKPDSAALLARLHAAKTACEDFDSFAAYEILAELAAQHSSPQLSALLQRALSAAEGCDYDGAARAIRQIEELSAII